MFDKWAVYLAFTVNEEGCDDVLSASVSLCCYEVRVIGLSTRSGDAIARSLPKDGTSL